jgi:hypothetical protein
VNELHVLIINEIKMPYCRVIPVLLVELASNFIFISGNPLIYVHCTKNMDSRRKNALEA